MNTKISEYERVKIDCRDGYSGILIRISRNSLGGLDKVSSGVIYPRSYSIVTSISREGENYYTRSAIKPLVLEKNEIFHSYWDASNFLGAVVCFDASLSLFLAVYAITLLGQRRLRDRMAVVVFSPWKKFAKTALPSRGHEPSAIPDGGKNFWVGISGLWKHCVTYELGLRNS